MSLCTLAGATVAGYAATASKQRAASATWITIVRPVNLSGHARPGFTVTSPPPQARFPIDCSFPLPSPTAVSRSVDWCFPSALYPVACWKAARPHEALCMQDARSHQLVRFARSGAFAQTGRAPADKRAPLDIVLGDGDYCRIRGGGAWSSPPGHPHLVGYYSCAHDGAVWAQLGAAHNGIDESQPMWRVRTAHFNSSRIVTRPVVGAYFVGTFSG
jgi:hypothetical protein